MTSVETVSADWPGAIILIFRPGQETLRRAAVFLFDLPGGGFSWAEPQIWTSGELGPTMPCIHDRPRAKLDLISERRPELGFNYRDDEFDERGLVFPWEPGGWPETPSLAAFKALADVEALDLKAERERVRPALSAALRA
jgi:hypothetical protein